MLKKPFRKLKLSSLFFLTKNIFGLFFFDCLSSNFLVELLSTKFIDNCIVKHTWFILI